jgi:hypothetical protein
MCMKEQATYCQRLQKEVIARRLVRRLTDAELDELLVLLRSDNGKPFNERIVRPEYRESNHID